MPGKPIVILVHGMGDGAPPKPTNKKLGEFGEQFVEATDGLLTSFSKHKQQSITDFVDVEEFYYNDTFETIAKTMGDQSKTVADRFVALQHLFPGGGGFLPEFIGRYSGWESKFGSSKNFFFTHWLDVLFYMTYVGEKIRIDLQQRLAETIRDTGNASRIHIVAHSLGTAVVHDALQKLYPPGGVPVHGGKDWFSVESDQLGSIWMVSNVSKLINSVINFPDPTARTSTVKPGPGGCAIRFYNVRHRLDPFTLVRPFRPKNDGTWLTHESYELLYGDIPTELVLDANTHSFGQYISNPRVGLPMIARFIGNSKFKTTKKEVRKLVQKHAAASIQGAYSRLEQAFEGIDYSNADTIDKLLEAGEAFRAAIDNIRKELT